ncbi:MAG TPA: hypothetical protein VF468_07490, partial [Actinomycetota bacterium]|nr:hypothetical protein [Actinomycetota bacterium]
DHVGGGVAGPGGAEVDDLRAEAMASRVTASSSRSGARPARDAPAGSTRRSSATNRARSRAARPSSSTSSSA